MSTSDRRLKRDIYSIEDALNKIIQINGVTWKWLSDGTTDMGVIAQEVEKVFPELVVTNSNGKKSVKYGKKGRKLYTIEVKSGRKKSPKGLEKFKEKFLEAKLVLITLENYKEFERNPMKFLENS